MSEELCKRCKHYMEADDVCWSDAPYYETMSGVNCKHFEAKQNTKIVKR